MPYFSTMRAVIILALLGMSYASPRRSNPVNTAKSIGVPLPASSSGKLGSIIPIIQGEKIPKLATKSETPPSVMANIGVPLPRKTGTITVPIQANTNFGVNLPRSSSSPNAPLSLVTKFGVQLPKTVSSSDSAVPSTSNLGVNLPRPSSKPNSAFSIGTQFGVSLPKGIKAAKSPISPTSNVGIPLPRPLSPKPSAKIPSLKTLKSDHARLPVGNTGVPLPKAGLKSSASPTASLSSTNIGVPLPPLPKAGLKPSSSPTASLSSANIGVPLPTGSFSQSSNGQLPSFRGSGDKVSSFRPQNPLFSTASVSSGKGLPLNSHANIPSHRSSLGNQRFIVTKESAEDAFSKENTFRSNENPLLRSIEDDYDDIFSRELFGDDDDDDDIIAQISLGRRFHPLGVPRRKAPAVSISSSDVLRQRNEPISNPHIHHPNSRFFFDDDSLEIDDDDDDDDDDDRKVFVNLSPSVRAFNHDSSDEQLFLHQDALNNYNYVDVKGAVNWGYKTNDQYQQHVVNTDGSMNGRFGWTAPEGSEVNIKYVADKKGGYRVLSSTGAYQEEAPDVLAAREKHFQAHNEALARLNPTDFAARSGIAVSKPAVTPFDNIGNLGVPIPITIAKADEPKGRISGTEGFASFQNENDFPLLLNRNTVNAGTSPTFGVPIPKQEMGKDTSGVNIIISQEGTPSVGVPLPSKQGRHIEVNKNIGNASPGTNTFGVPLPNNRQDSTSSDTTGVTLANVKHANTILSVNEKNTFGSFGVPLPSSSVAENDSDSNKLTSTMKDTPAVSLGVDLPVLSNDKRHPSLSTNGEVGSFDMNVVVGVQLPVRHDTANKDQVTLQNFPPQLANVNIGVPIPKISSVSLNKNDGNTELGLEPLGALAVTSFPTLPILKKKKGRADSEKSAPEQSVLSTENIGLIPLSHNPLLNNPSIITPVEQSFGVRLPSTPQVLPVNNIIKTGQNIGVPIPSQEESQANKVASEIETLPPVQTVKLEGTSKPVSEIIPIVIGIPEISKIATGVPLPPNNPAGIAISTNNAGVSLRTMDEVAPNLATKKSVGVPLPPKKVASIALTTKNIEGMSVPAKNEESATVATKKIIGVQLPPKKVENISLTTKNIAAVSLPAKNEAGATVATKKIIGVQLPPKKVESIALITKNIAAVSLPAKNEAGTTVPTKKIIGVPLPPKKVEGIALTTKNIGDVSLPTKNEADTTLATQKLSGVALPPKRVGSIALTTKNIADASIPTTNEASAILATKKIAGVPLPPKNVAGNVVTKNVAGIPLDTKSESGAATATRKITGVPLPAKNEAGKPLSDKNAAPTSVDASNFISLMDDLIIPLQKPTKPKSSTGVPRPNISTKQATLKSTVKAVSSNKAKLPESNSLSVSSNVGVPLPGSNVLNNILAAQRANAEPSFVRNSGVALSDRTSNLQLKSAIAPVRSSQPAGVSLPSEKIEAPSSIFIGKPRAEGQNFGVILPVRSSIVSKIAKPIRSSEFGVPLPSSLGRQENRPILSGENSFNNLVRLSRSSSSNVHR